MEKISSFPSIVAPVAKDYTIKKQAKKVPIYIPHDLIGKFMLIHKDYNGLEWSGLIFTEQQGSIEENNISFTLKDFVLMDLGTSGYTEFDMNADYLEYQMDIDPELKWTHHLLHSHNKMQCFYSGTDQKVFEENCEIYNIFLSVVVNERNEFYGKVGTIVEENLKVSGTKLIKNSEGNLITVPVEQSVNKKYLYEWECEFIMLNPYSERIKELKQIKTAKQPKVFPRHEGFKSMNQRDFSWDVDYFTKNHKQLELFPVEKQEKEFVLNTAFIDELYVELFGVGIEIVKKRPSYYIKLIKEEFDAEFVLDALIDTGFPEEELAKGKNSNLFHYFRSIPCMEVNKELVQNLLNYLTLNPYIANDIL